MARVIFPLTAIAFGPVEAPPALVRFVSGLAHVLAAMALRFFALVRVSRGLVRRVSPVLRVPSRVVHIPRAVVHLI